MSIRTKLFLILGVSQFVLVLVMAISFIYLLINIREEPQVKRAQEHIRIFERELEQKQQKLDLVLTNIVKNPEAVQILGTGFEDRKYLQANIGYFQNIMKLYDLDILELGESSGKVWTRFHSPDQWGDDKNYQKIIISALKGSKASALEVGNHGLALRTVIPYSDLGTLMVGQIVDEEFLADMSYGKDFHLGILQEDVLIAASDHVIKNFVEKFPARKVAGKSKEFDEHFYYTVIVPYEDGGLSSIKLSFVVLIDETSLQSMIQKIWWTVGLISFLILTSGFAASYFFSKDILAAFRILVSSMKNFKEEEDRGLSGLVKSRSDEIGEMAGIFLGMKTDLSAYQFHLQEMVELKTNELKQSNQKLDEANEFLRNRQYQIEHEFMVAQNLQGHLLPEPDRLLGPTQVRALYIPASGVSGDIYDFGMLSERECYFFMADVSGHGVPAAMVTAMIKISLSKIPLKELSPGRVLEYLNEEMVKILDDHYFSAILCKVDFHKRTLFYANAGSTPALLVRTLQNKVKILKSTGTVLGVFEGSQIEDFQVKIEPGDKLFLFSDGLSEESDPNKRLFGIRKIIGHLKNDRFSTNTETLQSLHSSLKKFSGAHVFKDDITCILANIG